MITSLKTNVGEPFEARRAHISLSHSLKVAIASVSILRKPLRRWPRSLGSTMQLHQHWSHGKSFRRSKCGMLFSPNDVPPWDTARFNFIAAIDAGTHIFVRPPRSFDVGMRVEHVSNAYLGRLNPGVPLSRQLTLGYSCCSPLRRHSVRKIQSSSKLASLASPSVDNAELARTNRIFQ